MDSRSRHGDYHLDRVSHDKGYPKEQDVDRLDSGIESFTSYNSLNSIGYHSMERSIEQDMSNMSLGNSVSTQRTKESGRLDDPKLDVCDEWCDSGFERSIPEVEEQEPAKTEETSSSTGENIIKWYVPNIDGDTYLQLAIIHKSVEAAFKLIQCCNIPRLLDVPNSNQQTALHLSVLLDLPQITRCLVAYGADVKCKNSEGNTALHLACERGLESHIEMLTACLDRNEDPGLQKFPLPQDINERNYLGFTPLHLAVTNNHPRVVRYLLSNFRCDVDMPDLKSGRTALHHAVEGRNIEITQAVLQAHPNIDALTYDECSSLHLAAARGLRAEAELLIQKGADLYLITRDDTDVFELSEHSVRMLAVLREAEKKHRLHHLLPTVMG